MKKARKEFIKIETFKLKMLDGSSIDAIKEGNNAAWLCICDRSIPLLATTRNFAGDTLCDCGRIYRAYPYPHKGHTLEIVEEIKNDFKSKD